MYLGTSVRISAQARRDWQREREAAAAAGMRRGTNTEKESRKLALRANCLENNLVLWGFKRGKRSSVAWVRNAPAASKQWHDLKVRVSGTKVEGYLDGKLYLEHTLPGTVSGRVGLWSKADSYMHFSDYTVTSSE